MPIRKLKFFFRFSNTYARLIHSYLSQRTQCVFLKGKWSDSLPLDKGVPQGSILEPLFSHCMSIIYLYNIFALYNLIVVQLRLDSSADDISRAVDCLSGELEWVFLWAITNGLGLNPGKSKCILLLRRSVATWNLRIIFNCNLAWDNHINLLVGQTYIKLRALWSTQFFVSMKTRILIVKTYLIACLLYGYELFANCDSSNNRKLNVLFNNIVR